MKQSSQTQKQSLPCSTTKSRENQGRSKRFRSTNTSQAHGRGTPSWMKQKMNWRTAHSASSIVPRTLEAFRPNSSGLMNRQTIRLSQRTSNWREQTEIGVNSSRILMNSCSTTSSLTSWSAFHSSNTNTPTMQDTSTPSSLTLPERTQRLNKSRPTRSTCCSCPTNGSGHTSSEMLRTIWTRKAVAGHTL